MKKGIMKTVVVLLSLVLLFTGCGNVEIDGVKDQGTAVQAQAKDAYSDDVKIAFLPHSSAPAAAVAWQKGIERELAPFSNVKVQAFDGKSSAETQVQIMSDLVNQSYDAIILQPSDAAALASSVQQAEDAGIPVICVNLDVSKPHAALVAMVDYEAGAIVAKNMAEELNEKGKVVIIQATPGATRGELLEAGFRATMKNYPNIEILDAQSGEWVTEKANVVMNDFLTKYSEIDGVFAHNDAMAEGASAAAEAAGRLNDIVIWGANGEAKALKYIEDGKMTGTIYTNCYAEGETAARLAMMYIGSKGVIDTSKLSATPLIKMAPIAVTKKNVGNITTENRW